MEQATEALSSLFPPTIHSGLKVISTAVVLVLMTIACTPIQTYTGKRLPLDQVAVVTEPSDHYRQGAARSVEIVALDGQRLACGRCEILPGNHRIEVEATWSNKWKDKDEFAFAATAGRTYLVGIYELRPGEDPATADFRPWTSERIGWAMLWYLSFPLHPFIGPPLLLGNLIYDLSQEEPQGRPYDGCCFLWIQDEQSGEVMAGATPVGSGSNQGPVQLPRRELTRSGLE